MISETISYDGRFEEVMTGEEKYPVIGWGCDAYPVTRKFKGLPKYAGCYEKNYLALQKYGGVLVAGSLRVISADGRSAYGFDYNPPNEVHVWVMKPGGVIYDFSLPGVIERGSTSTDDIGFMLSGRKPVILAGRPPEWLRYCPVDKLEIKP